MSKCNRCNRTLKNPEAIRLGYGKVCYAKMMAERENMQNSREHYDKQLDSHLYPLDESVVLIRNGDSTQTNVPHLVQRHSPDGFEWGYGGSGPADLALNICEYYLRILAKDGYQLGKRHEMDKPNYGYVHDVTFSLYQDFKFQFIATMEKSGGVIPANEVISFLQSRIEKQASLF